MFDHVKYNPQRKYFYKEIRGSTENRSLTLMLIVLQIWGRDTGAQLTSHQEVALSQNSGRNIVYSHNHGHKTLNKILSS